VNGGTYLNPGSQKITIAWNTFSAAAMTSFLSQLPPAPVASSSAGSGSGGSGVSLVELRTDLSGATSVVASYQKTSSLTSPMQSVPVATVTRKAKVIPYLADSQSDQTQGYFRGFHGIEYSPIFNDF
jgi:hypothetical protein